jgi:alkaline phosphatase
MAAEPVVVGVGQAGRAGNDTSATASAAREQRKAKNVILFVGDGMGDVDCRHGASCRPAERQARRENRSPSRNSYLGCQDHSWDQQTPTRADHDRDGHGYKA